MNDILKAINERRAVRDFKPDQIKEEDLQTILEAGRQAPSAWNRQPWHFTVLQKKSLMERIVDAARTSLQKKSDVVKATPWLVVPGFNYLYHAPTVVWVSGQTSNENAMGDCAIAVMNMVYAAHSLGIQSCVVITVMAAFETESGPEFLKELGIPEGYKLNYALALGHTSKPLPPPAPRKENFINYVR